jgi:hypothetical protein
MNEDRVLGPRKDLQARKKAGLKDTDDGEADASGRERRRA